MRRPTGRRRVRTIMLGTATILVVGALKSGVSRDGHVAPYTMMPWANFSSWTEKDRHAVVVDLRHLKPVKHAIPEPVLRPVPLRNNAVEEAYGGADYGGAK